jgi:hypothetical protein
MGGLSDRPHGRVCNVTETGRFAPDRSFGRGRAPARANRLDEGPWRIRALRLLCLTPLPALARCAVEDSHIAHEAPTRLMGMAEVDLESGLGAPDQHSRFGTTDN